MLRELALPIRFAIISLVFLQFGSVSEAQEGATPPHWIWYGSAKKGDRTQEEVRYFRKAFNVKEPSRLVLESTADQQYTLFVDGKEVASGNSWRSPRALSTPIATGDHVLAAKASKKDQGPAGFILRGGILPLGQSVPVHTDHTWRATDQAPKDGAWLLPGFDDRGWAAAEDLGPNGIAPWNDLAFAKDNTRNFKTPAGFRVDAVASPEVTGSVIAFTFDETGQPCVSVERDSIFRLVDSNADGTYDKRVPIAQSMTNCQGISFIKGKLYAVGFGPSGTGIYRLSDENNDRVYEKNELIRGHDGQMGEHGPHAIALGPDGKLYHNVGNHAHLKQPIDPRSPVMIAYEGELLPHYNDPRGHAAGILAPGGEIYRSDDDGASWSRISAGYRNHYDFSFNRAGDLFSFDSDMEWDQGLPWYRPVRVTHATIGSEFGWRNGSTDWPDYFFDSLPPTLELGRGSPTGVTFYQGNAFPPGWDDNLLLCDWSQGRILAVDLKRTGASYKAEAKELVSGQPLNCTDIEVGPDGAVYFATGGRNTEGGLYRIRWENAPKPTVPKNPIEEAIGLASPMSSFSQARASTIKLSLGDQWGKELAEIAYRKSEVPVSDRLRALDLLAQQGPVPTLEDLAALSQANVDERLRARALTLIGLRTTDAAADALAAALNDSSPLVKLRACEGLIQQLPFKIPVQQLSNLLTDPDRLLRFTARVAIEHADISYYRRGLARDKSIRRSIEGLLALTRSSKLNAEGQDQLLMRTFELLNRREELSDDDLLDLLRVIQLTFELGVQKGDHQAREHFTGKLLQEFPSKDARLSKEMARLLAFFGEPKAIEVLLKHQGEVNSHAEQIHYAYCLRVIKQGWTEASKRKFWEWFQTASRWEGGFSYLGYLDFMIQDTLPILSESEIHTFIAEGDKYPFPARVLVRSLNLDTNPARVKELSTLYDRLSQSKDRDQANDLAALIIESLGKSKHADARSELRRLFQSDHPRRDILARALANDATNEDLPILVQALETRDPNTASMVVSALRLIEKAPEGSAGLRNLILLARRTGSTFVASLNELGTRWSGLPGPAKGLPADKELAYWESEYAKKFPDAPLPKAEAISSNAYTFEQLLTNVIRAGLATKGAPERGKQVLARARCLECHKFGNEGAGLGPDLTTVNSRFRPHEILESVVHPSVVISDQYKSVTIATSDGKIHTGMPIVNQGENLVLLLADGTKTTIPAKDIEERKDSKLSVMPEGLLNAFGYQEIGDLISLFVAQPRVEGTGK